MCQRYVLPHQAAAEREFLPANAWWKFAPRFNVAPAQYVPAIRLHEGHSEGVMLRWGLIPAWWEGPVKGLQTSPAADPSGTPPVGVPKTSVESGRIASSKIFAQPWLGSRRCILPIAGFYTWQLTRENYRQPFFVQLTDRPVFGVAALWDRWVSEEDDVIESCSIIRVQANDLMSNVAESERGMPAILRRRDYQLWLAGAPAEAGGALHSYNAKWMQAYPVSPRINSHEVDDPALIRAAS